MSVFDQNNNQEQANNLLETLVGEGQKYKTAEELAKGYQHADEHIARLTHELKEIKEQSTSSTNITEAVKNKNSQDEAKDSTPADLNGLSKDELINLVKGVVNEDKSLNAQQSNLSQIDEFLTNKFGDKAPQEAARIAQSNGMTLEQMKELSATSPQAVMTLCGGAGQTVNNTGTFQSSVNTSSNPETIKGSSHYNKLRKENPKAFYSRAIQNEMKQAIDSLGNDFLNN